ncbi:hypothetical protein KPH14_003971 [Odynerus spinipes]|uniref:Transcription termination factor 5, mitochondrial n=1 Tax=Odynerus spinipes TaxID=1348599 RepID=A0AAD9RXQ0_9HYME|nr:hypothetical protein KPH14_003971 [Odynerus spinipes]
MKFSRHITNRLFSIVSPSKLDYHDLLLKHLPIGIKDADNIMFLNEKKLLQIPPDRFIKNCELLRNFNVELNPTTNVVNCLNLHHTTVKHRIFLLQEMGVPTVDVNLIYRLPVHMKASANNFKRKSNIPMNEDIMTNLLSHINNINLDSLPLKLLDPLLPLFMHYEQCFAYHIRCELDIIDLKALHCIGRKYKSIRLSGRLFKLFKEEIGVDENYFKCRLYISDMCPDNVEYMLESLENIQIGSLTVREAIKKKPQISQYDPENIKQLLQSFKTYGIPPIAVNRCLQVCKLKHEVFIQRMKQLLSFPDTSLWTKNPQILHIILNENIGERIDYLREIGHMKWINMRLLISNDSYFAKFKKDEIAPSNKRTYVRCIIYKEIGSNRDDIVELLTRHPYWNRVSFLDIYYTLQFLKERFHIKDICCNIHLILYPRSAIEATLENIENYTYIHNQKYTFTSSQLLALCLYLIEKNNHFTGDGIWNLNPQTRKPIEHENILLEDTSCESDETVDMLNNNHFISTDQQ